MKYNGLFCFRTRELRREMTFLIIFINPFLGIEIYSSHLAL